MDIFTKRGLVFMVQVDHLSGENLGQVIGYLYDAGASNVQIIPTITKKNRPSHLFIIDCRKDYADGIEEIIIRELTSGGWHRIDTEHRHLRTDIIKCPVEVVSGESRFKFTVEGKHIGDDRSNIRPEHQNCTELKNEVFQKLGKHISLTEAHYKISEVLNYIDKKEIFI
jgi:uncharacterized protein (DUF111 family)